MTHFMNAREDTNNYTAMIDTVFVVCLIFVPKTVCCQKISFQDIAGEKSAVVINWGNPIS